MKKLSKVKEIISFLIILIISINVYNVEYIRFNNLVIILNFFVIVISIFFMYRGDRYNYSLNKIFYLFSFFFFGVSPAIEYLLNRNYWRGQNISDTRYIKMNILILMILFIYQALYFIFQKINIFSFEKKITFIFKNQLKLDRKNIFKIIFFTLISLVVVLYQNKFDLKNLLLRGGKGVEKETFGLGVDLILGKFIKPMPAILLIYLKVQNKKNKLLEIYLIIILLLTNFPTGSARFYIAAVYIPLLLLYIKPFQKKLNLNKSLILGLLFIFPILDEMRRFKSLDQIKLGFKFKMFLEGHFDSFQNFMRVIENDIITNGSQLITALFFFIPRSLWQGKSVGSGNYLANKIGLSFTNIGMNYFGEGYINFGYYGVILFTIFLAWFNSRFDKIYWNKINKEKNFLSVIYLIMLGMEFFILRGDLISSFAYTCGILFSAIFIYYNLK